jgi:hypothetical protein
MFIPPFGKFFDQLLAAGIQTGTARGFWGGVTSEGEIVVTSWTDDNNRNERFFIHRPETNHGGLKTAWDVGNIREGAEVRMILVRQRGSVPLGQGGRQIKDAVLMPQKFRVVEIVEPDLALIEAIH